MISHHAHKQSQLTQSITRIKTYTKTQTRLRRLADSCFLLGGSSQKPRIGLSLVRRLVVHSKPPGGFLEFSRNAKTTGFWSCRGIIFIQYDTKL